MKTKVLLITLMLLMLLSSAALAISIPGISQTLGQNSNQAVSGNLNNSTVNQTTSQNANQNVQGNIGSNTVNQTTSQNANQSVQGNIGNTGINQTTGQNANQSIRGSNISNSTINQNINQSSTQNIYFVSNTQAVTITSEQKTVVVTTAQSFVTSVPTMRMYIMPVADLQQFVTAGRTDVVVVDVSLSGAPVSGFSNAIVIPLNQLTTRISEIPAGKTIAVVSDDDIVSAEAMTILRLQGFNAWVVKTGVC